MLPAWAAAAPDPAPAGVLRITKDQVPVPIADARRVHVGGEQLPLIQKNDLFFIVANPEAGGPSELEALPAYGGGARSVAVSEGGILHVLEDVKAVAGYLVLGKDETLPLLRSEEDFFDVEIGREEHRARLRIPRGRSEGAFQQLPASEWTNAAGGGNPARPLFSMDDVIGVLETRGETFYLFRDRQSSEGWFRRLASFGSDEPSRPESGASYGDGSRLRIAWAAVREWAVGTWGELTDPSPNRPLMSLLIPWAIVLAGIAALATIRSRRRQSLARRVPTPQPRAVPSAVSPSVPSASGASLREAAAAAAHRDAPAAGDASRPTLRLAGTHGISQAGPLAGDLRGTIPTVSLSWLFQMLHGQAASGTIEVLDEAGHAAGKVYLKEGDILDAQHRGLRGAEALYGILALGDGQFVFHRDRLPLHVHATVRDDLMHLLIEAQRRIDESRPKGASDGSHGA